MTTTGWMGGDGPDGGPAMLLTQQQLRNRERGPGDTLALAVARSRGAEARQARDEAAGAPDPDEYAAGLVSRGYAPAAMVTLGQRLGDKSAELAGELAKIEKGERRAARVRGMLERGQVGGLEASRMMDGDFGDAHRAEQLQRQCERLRREIAEAAEAITPPQSRQLDGVESAASRARALLAEVTRGQPAQERPPFGSASRFAGRSTEHTGPDCRVCAEGRRMEAVITADRQEITR